MAVNILTRLEKLVEHHRHMAEEYTRVYDIVKNLGAEDNHHRAVRKMRRVAKRAGHRGRHAGKQHKNGSSIKDFIRTVARGLPQPFTFGELLNAALPEFKTSSKAPANVLGVELRKIHREFKRTGKPGHYKYTIKEAPPL